MNAAKASTQGGLEVLEVLPIESESSGLIGYAIDAPTRGCRTSQHTITLEGWLLGRERPAQAIELVHNATTFRRTTLWILRPDVARSFPDVPHAESSGFRTTVSLVGRSYNLDIRLDAVLADESRVPIALIRTRHGPIATGFEPQIAPLLVTSIARTGTTWLMRLLTEHPSIVAHRSYPYETRAMGFWLDLVKRATEPVHHFEEWIQEAYDGSLLTGGHNPMHLVGSNPYFSEAPADYANIRTWLEGEYARGVARMSQQEIEEFYLRLAASYTRGRPAYFAEKCLPNHVPWIVSQIYTKWREVFLVRDLRDVVCSVLDFSAKHSVPMFGRAAAKGDVAYIGGLFRTTSLNLLHDWLARAQWSHLVRYEDLVRRTQETLADLLDYLELESSPAMVAEMIERASVSTPELVQHRTSPDIDSSIGRWRRDMDPWIQGLTREFLGEVLHAFGYDDA